MYKTSLLSSLLLLAGILTALSPQNVTAREGKCDDELTFEPAKTDLQIDTSESQPLVHQVSLNAQTGRTFAGFANLVLNNLSSREQIQAAWPASSFLGQVWTFYRTRRFITQQEVITVHFTIADGFRFFDPDDSAQRKDWELWLKDNSSRHNRFSHKQTSELKSKGYPHHSAYYDERKIVGLKLSYHWRTSKWQNPYEAFAWNVVNFGGIRRISIQVPEIVASAAGVNQRTWDVDYGQP